MIGYTKWQAGEPNNGAVDIEACVYVDADVQYTWLDLRCWLAKCYLCELEG